MPLSLVGIAVYRTVETQMDETGGLPARLFMCEEGFCKHREVCVMRALTNADAAGISGSACVRSGRAGVYLPAGVGFALHEGRADMWSKLLLAGGF